MKFGWPWRQRTVTLVVDDGPSDVTPVLLSGLEAAGHRAVLFVVGCHFAGREAMVVDAVRRGFALGNHSFSHPRFSDIEPAAARVEIEATEVLIDTAYTDAGVTRPGRWFRFPYLDTGGEHHAALQDMLRDLKFERPRSVGKYADDQVSRDWPTTLNTRDWSLPDTAELQQAVSRAVAGDVIEFHDKIATVPRYLDTLVATLASLSLRAVIPGSRR